MVIVNVFFSFGEINWSGSDSKKTNPDPTLKKQPGPDPTKKEHGTDPKKTTQTRIRLNKINVNFDNPDINALL